MAGKRYFGPAMTACNERERAFVLALLETGSNMARAAEIAGYGGVEGSARTAGWRLSHRKRVVAAVKEETETRINLGAAVAGAALLGIVADPLHKDHYKATVEVLNRAGLQLTTKHEVNVRDDRSLAQLEQFVLATAEKYGMDPKKLLGKNEGSLPAPIDAEFEEVDEEDDLSDILG